MPLSVGVAHRRRHAGIRHRHDDVGRHAGLARQFGADALARVVDRRALHHRIGPREVDVLEHAEPLARAAERLDAVHALVVDHDDLAGLHVAHEVGADDVERAGLAGQHPAAGALGADAAEDQRPHAERIAHAHQRLVGQRDQRIGADHLLQRVDQPIDHGGIQADRDQVDEHLGVGGGLEQAAAAHQRAAQHVRVGQVAVVRDREAAELEIGIQRLHVAQDGVAGGGVAVVADRGAAGQRRDHPRIAEIVADQAEAAMRMEVLAVEA